MTFREATFRDTFRVLYSAAVGANRCVTIVAALAVALLGLSIAPSHADNIGADRQSDDRTRSSSTGPAPGFTLGTDALPETVPEVAEFIRNTLERQGFDIKLTLDHAAAAKSVDLSLPPTQVVFFGHRRLDTALIRRSQTTALDLPLRFLIWEDEAGEVRIVTNGVGFLLDRHQLPAFDLPLYILSHTLTQFGGADNGIRTVQSVQTFDETLATLLATLEARGFRIPLVLDYTGQGRGIDKPLRPTTLVMFGNPNVGTPLMQNSRSIGLDLPQKMLIYEDADGAVRLAYNDPFYLASKHASIGEETPLAESIGEETPLTESIGVETRLGNIAGALRNIAETAAGITP